ncbi:MAG: hypothetical protein NTX36_06960 [Proteobacteria bacterium]|nr:hypothetical protein [Pseudomonadota bacterium]
MKTEMTNLEKKQIDLIKESICVYTKCVECITLFKRNQLSFAKIEEFVDDKGKSCLFKLKEMCHELFRTSDEAHYKEKLYDITVGYIFHEAMKLRENLYQLEYYRPNRDNVSERLTNFEKKIVHEIESLTKKADKRLREGLKEIRVLMKELVGQLKGLICLYDSNYLIPRFVLENEKALIAIYGKKGFENLLNDLYHDGRPLLLYMAAKSYLESEYYEIARNLFRKISKMDNENKTATFFYMYASAFYFYFKNMFSRSFIFAQHATGMDVDDELIKHKDSLRNLIADISKEIKKTKSK